MEKHIVLTLSCPDQPGISARVLSFFANKGFNILESSQYEDPYTNTFFIRILIAVSDWGYCLSKLLNAWYNGQLPVEIVSNHESQHEIAGWYKVPFYYFPVTRETKPQQEQQILDCMKDRSAELLVLARYMQILSDNMCQQISGKIINIHHSSLPGFKGAKPYHQAYERGVKLIGATAHYVTSDLDEGPIIEQTVERISHANLPEELVDLGRDIETVVLNRAVKWHAEGRVILNGNRAVVFR